MLTDDNIIQECAKGNRLAMQMLYEQHSRRLLGICRRYAGSAEEAKDWMHEGWLRIFENIKYYRGDGNIESWLGVVMRNTAIEMAKQKSKHTNIKLEDIEVEPTDLSNEEYDKMVNYFSEEQIIESLSKLSEQYRIVFNLSVIDGFSHKEIASKLGINEGTSRSNLNRARKQLIEILRCEMNIRKNQNSVTKQNSIPQIA